MFVIFLRCILSPCHYITFNDEKTSHKSIPNWAFNKCDIKKEPTADGQKRLLEK